MSTSIYDMFAGMVIGKMQERGMYNVVPEDFKGYQWDHPEYKKVEDARYSVLEDIHNDLVELLETMANSVVDEVAEKIEENRTNSFDPSI